MNPLTSLVTIALSKPFHALIKTLDLVLVPVSCV